MFGEIIYDVVNAGRDGHAIMRTRFGKTEFCGSDGYWARSPDYVTPFTNPTDAGIALGKLQDAEGVKPKNDKQSGKSLRHGSRHDSAARNGAARTATTVVKAATNRTGGGVQG